MYRITLPDRASRATRYRRGFTTPAVAVALLIGMMGLALILDRVWLETAQLELNTAAEAAALAGASELVSDDLLLSRDTTDLRINNAREVAAWIASQNYVCGTPVTLNAEPDGDVLLGHLVRESQGIRFVESDDNPRSVVVTALRTRSNNNPVGLFVSGVTGLPYGDVAARVEATVDNCVIGLRPLDGSSIPAIPIAIWDVDPSRQRSDTWSVAIRSRKGSDDYGYDSQTHTVYSGSDGIPELVIRSAANLGSSRKSNVRLIDIGNGLNDANVARQFKSGLNVEDVAGFTGELLLGLGQSLTFNSTAKLDDLNYVELQKLVGERRICFLYSTALAVGELTGDQTLCTDIVAVRIMSVSSDPDGSYAAIVQPTVVTTRTAILANELVKQQTTSDSVYDQVQDESGQTGYVAPSANSTRLDSCLSNPNPYVFKLQLTQ